MISAEAGGQRGSTMQRRLRAATVTVALASAFLMVFVVPAAAAATSGSALTPGTSTTLWAYGGVRTVHFGGASANRSDYEGTATYGFSVVLNQTNLSSTTFELSSNRTMGALLSVEYCSPSCGTPTMTATIYYHVWEAVDAWANFTTNGTVLVDGASVPAVALVNSHSTVAGSLADSAQGPLRSSYLSGNVSASSNVSFATPLGLFPDDLAPGMNWTSTAAFVASGAYALNYTYQFSGPHVHSMVGPLNAGGSVARSGNLTILGATGPGASSWVTLDKASYLSVSLSVIGPFAVREGFMLVPTQANLFGAGTTSPWSANATGGASAEMTSLDVQPGGDHLGIDASEWLYSGSALNPSSASALTSGLEGPVEITSDSDDVGATSVQGVPIPVDQAQGYQGCLVASTDCGPAALGAPFSGLLLAAGTAMVVAVLVTVVITERRRIPPPSYPNAKLYPPGGPSAEKPRDLARPAGSRRDGPSTEDDPLSNLW